MNLQNNAIDRQFQAINFQSIPKPVKFFSLSERVGVIDPEQYSMNCQAEEDWYH